MGEYVRERVLRALGLARVFVQLEALNTRLKRMEQDVLALQQQPRSQTIPASPPPPFGFDSTARNPLWGLQTTSSKKPGESA